MVFRNRSKAGRSPSPRRRSEAEAPGGAGGSPAGMLFNKAEPGKTQAGRLRPQEETRLAAAMQRDLRPVAKAIAEGLKKRDWGALRKKLGGMLPECGTESAGVIEEAVSAAGEEAQKNKKNGEAVAVANSKCRAKDPAHCPTHGVPEGRKEKPKRSESEKEKKPKAVSKNPDPPEVQKVQIAKARAALTKCLESHEDQVGAFSRGDIGTIPLLYGQAEDTAEGKAWGLAHFAQRKDTVEHLPETLILGEAGEPYQGGQKRNITWDKYTAVIALTNDPNKPPRWVLTAFQPSDRQNEGGHR